MYQHTVTINTKHVPSNESESHTMKKSSQTNWINMNELSGFLLYSSYFEWKCKIEVMPKNMTLP